MMSPEKAILAKVDRRRNEVRRPIVVALDGGSGAGKSTIARRLMRLADVALVPLDDFYQTRIPESEWRHYTVDERLNGVFDWTRVRRDALEPLRAGRPGRWHAFDFARGLSGGGIYSLQQQVTELAPAPTILLEGAYSAAPPLRDLIDLAVLVDARSATRRSRLVARGDDAGFLARWHEIWDAVERHYLEHVCPPHSFDVVIPNDEDLPPGVEAGGPSRG